MTTYYVDPVSGNNANAGTSTGAAWATLQKALTECNGGVVAASDTVVLMATGVETVTAEIATTIAKRVLFIGANASGVVDGTRYQITTNSAITSLLNFQHSSHIFAFVDFNANSSATHAVDCDNVGVITLWCRFRNAIQYGWFQGVAGGQAAARHYRSEFYSNGSRGCHARGGWIIECSAHDNTTDGFFYLTTGVFANCRSFKNGGVGFHTVHSDSLMFGCTSDDNTSYGLVSNFNSAIGLAANCLFTRNTYAIAQIGTAPAGSHLIQNMFGSSAFANSSGDNNLAVFTEFMKLTGDPDYVDPDGTPVDLHYTNGTPTEDTFAPWRAYLGAGFENLGSGTAPTDFAVVAATATTDYSADQTSHAINLPSGITAGDLLLLWFTMDGTTGNTITTPTGWTLEEATNVASPGDLGYLFSRTADGSEGSTVTVTTSASQSSSAIALRIENWDAFESTSESSKPATADIELTPLIPTSGGSGVAITFLCLNGARTVNTIQTGVSVLNTTASGSSNNTVAVALHNPLTVSNDLEEVLALGCRQSSGSIYSGAIAFVRGPASAGGGTGDYTFDQVKQIRYKMRQGALT